MMFASVRCFVQHFFRSLTEHRLFTTSHTAFHILKEPSQHTNKERKDRNKLLAYEFPGSFQQSDPLLFFVIMVNIIVIVIICIISIIILRVIISFIITNILIFDHHIIISITILI